VWILTPPHLHLHDISFSVHGASVIGDREVVVGEPGLQEHDRSRSVWYLDRGGGYVSHDGPEPARQIILDDPEDRIWICMSYCIHGAPGEIRTLTIQYLKLAPLPSWATGARSVVL
jgi:hypothetical protein